jgi:hypothetical protein
VLVVSGLLAAGCAIPTQHGPSTISSSRVPFQLLSPEPPSTTTTQPRASSLVTVKIFLLTGTGGLVAVQRYLLATAPLSSTLNALIAGPSNAESSTGMTTAIPNNVVVISTSTVGHLVTVNFSEEFAEISGESTEQAVAQVVATVVTQDGLGTGVIFEISGQNTSVPIASGALVPGPVYLWQFIASAS